MAIELYEHQLKALYKMKNGCILCGDTGAGKSRTAIAYYFLKNGGKITPEYAPMNDPPQDLYIITTARKRDTLDWEEELSPFLLSIHKDSNFYSNRIVVDSWNNVSKYRKVKGSFFIFDEQRVIGDGVWVKSFWEIAKNNQWILLSATPGDKWKDYIPVFVANGFYKNRWDFESQHCKFAPFVKYKKITGYFGTKKLERLRDSILIPMEYHKQNEQHHEDIYCSYNNVLYKNVMKNLWDIFEEKPLENASGLCYCLRRIVNSDGDRIQKLLEIIEQNQRVIIFYNFNYELKILKSLNYGDGYLVAEWNGHRHDKIPDSKKWVYLVQYSAGNEGWNCTLTDTMIFYSQNYSYRVMVQASGRIDRLNSTYHDLYYYHLKTYSPIDRAISRALKEKREFNEKNFSEHIDFNKGEKYERL